MSMIEELKSINRITIPAVHAGDVKTLGDFYKDFVASNELSVAICRQWFKVLADYAESLNDNELMFFVRKMEKEERRGYVTQIGKGMYYVFSDNSLAKVIYLLARNGFAPKDVNEFRECVRGRLLKCMLKSNKEENAKDAEGRFYSQFRKGSLPKLNGWFLAHIHSVNESYRGKYKKFEAKYFKRGVISDWSYDQNLGFIVRKSSSKCSSSDRTLFIAHFLRFLVPMNYFLVPLQRYMGGNRSFKDISSKVQMLALMREKRRERYGAEWLLFEKKALCGPFPWQVNDITETIVDITVRGYDEAPCACKKQSRPKVTVSESARVAAASVTRGSPKALRKIPSWADNSNCNSHKIIHAYFLAEQGRGFASVSKIRSLCSAGGGCPQLSVPRFDSSWQDLCRTDSDHSLGKVFDVNGGQARIWAPVMTTLNRYRNRFTE